MFYFYTQRKKISFLKKKKKINDRISLSNSLSKKNSHFGVTGYLFPDRN